MKRSEAVLQGAPLVHMLEEAAMNAVRACAVTTIGLIDLRRKANLSATVGEEAWVELFATTDALQKGLQRSLAFHRRMTEVKIGMGCRTVANGGGDKNNSDATPYLPTGAEAAPLRAVA